MMMHSGRGALGEGGGSGGGLGDGGGMGRRMERGVPHMLFPAIPASPLAKDTNPNPMHGARGLRMAFGTQMCKSNAQD